VWFLKCRALTAKNWIDDAEMEEEGVAEMLLDDNAMASAPR
jgi:tetratricopeptide repeat protein 8